MRETLVTTYRGIKIYLTDDGYTNCIGAYYDSLIRCMAGINRFLESCCNLCDVSYFEIVSILEEESR